MLTQRLASIFQIRPGEGQLVAFVGALFAFLEAGRGIGANAADGLFFVRFGVEFLPYMFMALGAVTFVITLSYAAGLGKFDKRVFFLVLLAGFAAVLLIERVAVLLHLPALYPVIWLSINIISAILGTFMWNVAADVCDARQAKRLFSLFVSAGILGGVLGNLLTGSLARLLGTENLLVVYTAFLLASLALMRAIVRQFYKAAPKRATGASLWAEVRAGFDFVRRSRLLQLIAVASILFSILFFSVAFPFSKVVSASFPSEAEVAGFLGLFSGAVTAITFVASLFIANRLYTRIGIVNAILILPLVYLAGFVLFAANYSLTTTVIVRLAQMVVLGGIASSAWGALFNVVPAEKRGQVQSFESGVPSQAGVALSGVLLILGERVLNTTQIFIMGMVVALVCTVLVWQMRHEYGVALVAALRAGIVDVFTATQRGFQNLRMDANARRVALAGLADAKPEVRRGAAEILARLDAREAIGPLSRALDDPDAEVRRAALEALVALEARGAVDQIAVRLVDPEPAIRAAAIDTLSALSPQAGARVMAALEDPDPRVRARAAVALYRAGDPERAQAVVTVLLDSPEPAERIAGLEALADCRAGAAALRVAGFLRDNVVPVRLAAVKALGALHDADGHQALIQALDDPDGRVRQAAANALRASDAPLEAIVQVLNTGSDRAQEAALIVLDGRSAARGAVATWALGLIPRAARLRAWSASLAACEAKDSREVVYLRDLLRDREQQIERRILRALALIGAPEALSLISEGIRSTDQEKRAQALEALETVGDKRIARGLIPLLEDASSDAPAEDARTVLKKLVADPDPWLRALAVRSMSDLLLRDWRGLLTHTLEDPAPVVREAAQGAVAIFGGEMTETLKTLGTVDRILFLRQVPLFNHLTPEDLQQIAEIAAERIFPPGEYLCREGDLGDELFVIIEGQVRVTKGSNGAARTLRTMQAGDHIGELAILREGPRSASVVAEGGDVRALVIGGEAFKAILRDRPEVAMAMLASLAERLSTL